MSQWTIGSGADGRRSTDAERSRSGETDRPVDQRAARARDADRSSQSGRECADASRGERLSRLLDQPGGRQAEGAGFGLARTEGAVGRRERGRATRGGREVDRQGAEVLVTQRRTVECRVPRANPRAAEARSLAARAGAAVADRTRRHDIAREIET